MVAMRNIRVVDYDPAWVEAFQREVEQLAPIFGEHLISIYHIGSTSVPGLPAKPIIDIMPVVQDIHRLEPLYPALIALGYEPLGENGIPGRRLFIKGGVEHRTHHVHTYGPDHPEVVTHLNFRDYLRAHPEVARQYAVLKANLARQFPHDIDSYIEGKAPFIRDILQKAAAWRETQG
jgi:GrpB-like predicted nucleotidyltransferase (UPF0157 family)